VRRESAQCPCLYVADPIYKGSTNKPRITGDRTKLNYPFGVAVAGDGDVYVANTFTLKFQEAPKNRGSVTLYAAGADGNAAPIRTIEGPQTGLAGPNEIVIH